MDGFMDYIKNRDPLFPTLIRGASQKEIETLENWVGDLVGLSLPPSYKRFLSRLGHNDGGLAIGLDSTTNIVKVLDCYQNDIAKGLGKIPPNCILIGFGGLVVPEVCLEFFCDSEPRVIISEQDSILEFYAESLEKLLFRKAFMMYALKRFPYATFLVGTNVKRLLEPAQKIALFLGFKPLWFSDAIAFCGERDDAIIGISQFEAQGLSVRIAAPKRAEVERMSALFINQLGVLPKGKSRVLDA
jgi:hypothetical protein